MHVYRWDLDRTYLDTDIGSVRGLIRSALENASDKRTIPGSAALLRQLVAHDPKSRVCILSGSPKQMRSVLEQKLRMDGVRVDRFILKDNLGNIRKGRLRDVRGQLGYKLPALLEERMGLGPAVQETLFGDDSEADAVIYGVYADALAGRLSSDDVARILEVGGAYPDSIDRALQALDQVGRASAIEDIFIRLDRGGPMTRFHLLGARVTPVFSWFQAALRLHGRGRLSPTGLAEVANRVRSQHALGESALVGLTQDAVRREVVSAPSAIEALRAADLDTVADRAERDLARLGLPKKAPEYETPDYVGFLRHRT